MGEGSLDFVEVPEYVGVVEFEIVYCEDVRAVVEKLAALVEVCGVVFVSLYDERRAGVEAAEVRAAFGKVERNAAD